MTVASQHNSKTPTRLLRRLIAMQLLVTAALFTLPAQAEEKLDFLPSTDTFRFDTQDRFYETRKYGSDFQIQRLERSEEIYLGNLRIREKSRFVLEKDHYFLGINQNGLELSFKF